MSTNTNSILNHLGNTIKNSTDYQTLFNLINDSDAILKVDLSRKNHAHSEYKNGIYFAYKNSEIIYIGKAGNGKYTSLYHRFLGHGKGSHKFDYDYVKFYKFTGYNNKQLLVLESTFLIVEKPALNKAF